MFLKYLEKSLLGVTVRSGLLVAALLIIGILAMACGTAAEPTQPAPTATSSAPQPTAAAPTATKSSGESMGTAMPTETMASEVEACPQKGVNQLEGAGATFPFPLYSQMFDAYHKLCNVQVNYQSIGSGGGQRQLSELTVDFGGSDGIMSAETRAQAKGGPVIHIPMVAGAVAVIYNLDGVGAGELKLTPEVLSGIYLKHITHWNDPQITAINPGVNLPDTEIAVVHRSDGSGTTFIFTNYLSKVSPEWEQNVGFSSSVEWPGDIGGQGNEGVAQQVKQIPGTIGYVELAYAHQNKLTFAQLQNSSGNYIEPSLDSAALAADVPTLPDNMEIVLTNTSNPNGYPIVGFTWLLVYENQTDAAKADAVARLAWWMIHDGQQYAIPLDYVPLKGEAVTKAENLIKMIKVNGQPVLQ